MTTIGNTFRTGEPGLAPMPSGSPIREAAR